MTIGLVSFAALFAFYGGKSQAGGTTVSGTYPFIDLMKTASNWAYRSTPTSSTEAAIPADRLDASGWVTSFPTQSGSVGVQTQIGIPSSLDYSGIWYIDWQGTGTLSFAGLNYSYAPTFSAANLTGTNGLCGFTRTDAGAFENQFLLITATNASPNHVHNIRIYRADQATLLAAGKIFNPVAVAKIREVGVGKYRNLGWMGTPSDGGNVDSTPTWALRKPASYCSQTADYINPSLWQGTTTSSGNDYSLAYTGYTLTDKATFHFQFGTASTQTATATVSVTNSTVTTVPAVVTHTGHAFTTGNSVAWRSGAPAPFVNGVVYFVRDIIAGTSYSLAATNGGTAISTTAAAASAVIVPIITLNVNSTGAFPLIKFWAPYNESVSGQFFSVQRPQIATLATATYDASTGFYVRTGGDSEDSSAGIHAGTTPEIFVDFCAAIGAHPHIVMPYLCVEPTPDWMTQIATYVKNTYPWMKGHYEPPNETWNTVRVFRATWYATWISALRWPAQVGLGGNTDQCYARWVSKIGQAVSAVYGNDRTKYSMLCSFQTTSPSSVRLAGGYNVSVDGDSPPYLWTDRVCGANYMSPDERGTSAEIGDAYDWSVTYVGNATQQDTIASNYVVTSGLGIGGAFNNFFQAILNIAIAQPGGQTVKGITYYEGGYSPDLTTSDMQSTVNSGVAPTKASPCVLTFANSFWPANGNVWGNGVSGRAGMLISISNIAGMTQLNLSGTSACSFTNGSANITCAGNSFQVGQGVLFSNSQLSGTGSIPPTEVGGIAPFPVWVVSAGNPFQVSLTKGGTAIVFNSIASTVTSTLVAGNKLYTVQNSFGQQVSVGWMVVSTSGNTVTIDCDSTAFSTYTSGGTLTWTGSATWGSLLRNAGKRCTGMGTVNTAMYAGLDALTGANPGYVSEFPSNFLLFGSDSTVWTILYNSYAGTNPQWQSIKTYNGH